MKGKKEHPKKAAVLKYAAENFEATYKQMANIFNLSKYTVEDWCRGAGIKRKIGGRTGGSPTKFTQELWAKMDREYAEIIREHAGDGVKALEALTGKNWRTIQSIAKRCGIKLRHKPRPPRRKPEKETEFVNGMPEIDRRVRSCKMCACWCNVCIYGFRSISKQCQYHKQLKGV